MRRSYEPPALCRTVKNLRLALGDTQQAFATRLGLAISTVVRYECSRAPKGKALAQLGRLASDNGLEDCAEIFAGQLRAELSAPPVISGSGSALIGFKAENPFFMVEKCACGKPNCGRIALIIGNPQIKEMPDGKLVAVAYLPNESIELVAEYLLSLRNGEENRYTLESGEKR